ncbi:MAG: hypothetical protein QXO37_07765 [Candidatus Nitrosocaldaceae archaeon]
MFEEYDLTNILSKEDNNNNNKEETIKELHAIKDRINEEISEANSSKDYKAKSILAKKLDKVLTLIALVESENREGISHLIAIYNLLNRNDKQLIKALYDLATKKEEEYRSVISKIKEERNNRVEEEVIMNIKGEVEEKKEKK